LTSVLSIPGCLNPVAEELAKDDAYLADGESVLADGPEPVIASPMERRAYLILRGHVVVGTRHPTEVLSAADRVPPESAKTPYAASAVTCRGPQHSESLLCYPSSASSMRGRRSPSPLSRFVRMMS
jgi:hypothetical protein